MFSASQKQASAPTDQRLVSGGRNENGRLGVHKTYKMWVGGKFIRSEQGRVLSLRNAEGDLVTHYVRASRKDLRDAVGAARSAQAGWSARSAFNRSQILFRAAEMIEARRETLIARLQEHARMTVEQAALEVDGAADRMFWYAGWTDKYVQVLSSVNPVATPFFNFTIPEPTGVVAIFAPENSPLLGLVSMIAPVILSGNTCVVVVENIAPTLAVELSEILATSDFPGGVVNLLTGLRDELQPHAVHHMDINAIASCGGNEAQRRSIQEAACESVKRVHFFEQPNSLEAWAAEDQQSLYWIVPFIEWKTAWHPIGV
ncbi:MAG: aldehyde dehydrogenase family protein [Myxococcales bacterium]|nr:aldehyde dehydrogenase family protein [Myxococcales bacterium]MCB9642258.1 aldehyde dehydrogenase family protein [Myxococcales bacterium]